MRGVTLDEPTGSSSVFTSRTLRFHSSTPPGFTILIAYAPVDFENPRGVILRAARLVRGDLPMQILVVAQQREEAAVDDRRVVELGVRLASGDGCDGGIEDGRVAEPGVAIAGGEGARHGAAGARARDRAVIELRRASGIERVLLREAGGGPA